MVFTSNLTIKSVQHFITSKNKSILVLHKNRQDFE